MNSRFRVVARRVVVVAVVASQVFFVARGYWADHKEFAFQMFPESSTWRADVVRVTADGRRVPVEVPWAGYRWAELVPNEGLSYPSVRRHATAGLAIGSPILFSSVAHGSGHDIVGKGVADPTAMIQAVSRLARATSRRR